MPSAQNLLTEEEAERAHRRRQESRGPSWQFLLPLAYAPLLPLIRIGFRSQPMLRDRLFTAAVGAALLHGGYLCTQLYDSESKSMGAAR